MRTLVAAAATLVASPVLAEDLVLTPVNDSEHAITEMYVAAVDQDPWGEHILNQEWVEPGVSGEVTIADGRDICDHDLRCVTAEGAEAEKTQDLCEIATFTVTD